MQYRIPLSTLQRSNMHNPVKEQDVTVYKKEQRKYDTVSVFRLQMFVSCKETVKIVTYSNSPNKFSKM